MSVLARRAAKTQRFVAAIRDRGTEVKDLGYKVERALRARFK